MATVTCLPARCRDCPATFFGEGLGVVFCRAKRSNAVVFICTVSSVFRERAAEETGTSLLAPSSWQNAIHGLQACPLAVQKLTAIKENEGCARVLCKRIARADEQKDA